MREEWESDHWCFLALHLLHQRHEAVGVEPGTVELLPSRHDNVGSFHTPTAAPGVVTLLPTLYTDDDTFFTSSVTQGNQNLEPSLYDDDEAFHAPTISMGAVALLPTLYNYDNTFFSPTVAESAGSNPESHQDVMVPELRKNVSVQKPRKLVNLLSRTHIATVR